MKLLGWMHRKSNHNSTESLKTFSIENSAYVPLASFDEQRHRAEPTFSYACSKKPNMKYQTFFTDSKANIEEKNYEEESFYVVFQGFLAIGTLGVEPLNTEPPTPTFPKIIEHITHEEMEITENDLKLINDKMETFLEAEDEEVANKTSERISNASIVTIHNNLIEDVDAENYGNMLACPLQKHLFGSSIELSNTEVQVKKEKEKSLVGDLLKRNIVHEHLEGKYEIKEKQVKERFFKHLEGKYETKEKKVKERSVTHVIKKMVNKLHTTSRTSKASSGGDAGQTALTKRKLPKVLKIFQRRVHPEELMAKKKPPKLKIGNFFCMSSYQEGEDEENRKPPPRADIAKEINSFGEHWIKTDDDYLVLEL